jgi:hypothetical protein
MFEENISYHINTKSIGTFVKQNFVALDLAFGPRPVCFTIYLFLVDVLLFKHMKEIE